MSASTLIISEHADIAELIATRAKSLSKFAQVETCEPSAAAAQLGQSEFDLLIMDVADDEEDYLDLLADFQKKWPQAWVVLMTELSRSVPVPMRAENVFRVARFNFESLNKLLAALAA